MNVGGSGLGPLHVALVTATPAEADASVAMVYLMHFLGTATISAARPSAAQALTPILQRLVQALIYPLSFSVKPARAVISGRPYAARIGMVTARALAPRNRG